MNLSRAAQKSKLLTPMIVRALVIFGLLTCGSAHAQQRTFSLTPVTLNVALWGSDKNDGLSLSAPMQHVEYAINVLRTFYDAPVMNVKLADGIWDQAVNCMGDGPGAPLINIIGNKKNPRNVRWTGEAISAIDKCILTVFGFHFLKPKDCRQFILAGQGGGIVDVDSSTVILGECGGGSMVQVNDGGKVNLLDTGPLVIEGDAANIFAHNHGGVINIGKNQEINLPKKLKLGNVLYNVGGKFLQFGIKWTGEGAGKGTVGNSYLVTGCGEAILSETDWPGIVPKSAVVGCGQVF